MSRAAIYARYSSDLQSAALIDDQVRLCRERLAADGHRLVEAYTDYAISCGSMKSRAGMQALLAEAQAGRFDVVYAEALDRVSRDQEDVAAIFKRLAHADAQLITLAEGEITELHIGLKGTMNALFLKDLAQKTKRGQRGGVEADKIAGGNSYGYRVVHRLLADGSPVTREREIDPAEAAIVRRIFEEYASGLPPRRIVAGLNAEGIPGPRGGAWNASTINGSRQRRNGILNNEMYLGRLVWNRQRFVKDPETGRRLSRPNPESAWITADVPELRIIDDDLWAKVQALKSRYASRSGNKRQKKKRLLSGLIRCGACGGAMTIVNRERYSCSARRERGTCNSPAGIRAADLEASVLDGLRDILLGREDLVEEFARAFEEELRRLQKTRASRTSELTSEFAKVERGNQRCLSFITEGDGDPGSVASTLRDLEARKTEIEAHLAAEPITRTVAIHPNVGDLYRRKVGELQTLLEDETTKSEAVEVIRGLIDRIEVRAGDKRGQPEVILVGALASVLGFAAANGKNGRVFMVAGAGFEPATFRL